MLTAKVREPDILRGFEMGADDYITKPFSAKQLLARIRAVLKRVKGEVAASAESEVVCGNLRIDLARRRVTLAGRDIRLTPTEYSLLHELAAHCNQVILHEQLLTAIWGSEYRNDLDYLRAYIHYLRQKLELNPSNPKIILSSPGVGYMLASPEKTTDLYPTNDDRIQSPVRPQPRFFGPHRHLQICHAFSICHRLKLSHSLQTRLNMQDECRFLVLRLSSV
jgi:two-component system KDP operon response regulator KdpE